MIIQPPDQIEQEPPFPRDVGVIYEMAEDHEVSLVVDARIFNTRIMDLLEEAGETRYMVPIETPTESPVPVEMLLYFDRIKAIIELDEDCGLTLKQKEK